MLAVATCINGDTAIFDVYCIFMFLSSIPIMVIVFQVKSSMDNRLLNL